MFTQATKRVGDDNTGWVRRNIFPLPNNTKLAKTVRVGADLTDFYYIWGGPDGSRFVPTYQWIARMHIKDPKRINSKQKTGQPATAEEGGAPIEKPNSSEFPEQGIGGVLYNQVYDAAKNLDQGAKPYSVAIIVGIGLVIALWGIQVLKK
jgi:hypothetical protein